MQRFFYFVIVLLLSCQKTPSSTNISFYHWKSNFSIEKNTLQRLENLECKKIYLRIFDVDFEAMQHFPTPIGTLNWRIDSFSNQFLHQYQIVPTVFITNRTFLKINDNQIDTLSKLIYQKILTTLATFTEGGVMPITTWQFDCDWTTATREKYFLLLKKIQSFQQGNNTQISATIRLHQFKFFEREGVPPVASGTLMAYNVGDLDNEEGENSILSLAKLEHFLPKKKNYPLPLDVALPIFSWGVVLRDGQAVLLIHGLQAHDFFTPSVSHFFKEKKDIDNQDIQLFVCQENTYFKGHYLYKNDEVRVETIAPNTLVKCAERLAEKMPPCSDCDIIFYHLDSIHLQRYSDETFKNIKNIFQRHR